jgi:glycerol-3-phosphate dehydrogenase
MRLAPHRVRPLRFVLPSYAGDRVGRGRLRLGLWLYDRLAGVRPELPRHDLLDAAALRRGYPFLESAGLRGGFRFGDCQMDDARFTLEIVDGALAAGAVAVNHAPAVELLTGTGRVAGAVVRDEETGSIAEVRARITACCAGPWTPALLASCPPRARIPMRLSKGVHLVLPPLPSPDALLLMAREQRRVVFVIPWHGRTLLGTTDTDYTGEPGEARVEEAEIESLLGDAARALPGRFPASAILGSFVGVRTLVAGGARASSALSRGFSLEEPLDGLIVPVGGKFTSARADAALVVERVLARLGRRTGGAPGPTLERPFPWSPATPWETWGERALARGLALGLDRETARTCQLRYGSRIEAVYARVEREPTLARRIVPDVPACRAEIVHAAEGEMARSLEDLLRRRLPLLLLGRLPDGVIEDCARLAGRVLGWSEDRLLAELAATRVHATV